MCHSIQWRWGKHWLVGHVTCTCVVIHCTCTLYVHLAQGGLFETFFPPPSQVKIENHPVRFFVHKRPHVDYFLSIVSLGLVHLHTCMLFKISLGGNRYPCTCTIAHPNVYTCSRLESPYTAAFTYAGLLPLTCVHSQAFIQSYRPD